MELEQMEAIELEINRIFEECDVREVDFMPTLEPPYVLFVEHVLGVSMVLLKPLYRSVYQKLMALLVTANDVKKASKWDSNVANQLVQQDFWTTALRVTQVVLVVKGDLAVAYNIRKKALLHNPHLLCKEFNFSAAIFSKHPKSPSGWEHRRWCLKQHLQLRDGLRIGETETEKELCRVMAEKYPRNYYAWMHRLWLLTFMTDDQVGNNELHVSPHSHNNFCVFP
jgi:protein prenyltransferase alpha subunit repeat containing protein 1